MCFTFASRVLATVAGLVLWSVPAFAGFDVEIPGETAAVYTGGCSAAGSYAGRTVPRCTGTADGTFTLRYFTRVLSGAATITPQELRFVTVGDPSDSAAATCWNVACTATTLQSNPHGTISYNAGTTVTFDMDAASPTCIAIDSQCTTGAFSAANVRNLQTAADCATTACNNAGLICQVKYLGTAGTGCTNGYALGADVTGIKLTVGP